LSLNNILTSSINPFCIYCCNRCANQNKTR